MQTPSTVTSAAAEENKVLNLIALHKMSDNRCITGHQTQLMQSTLASRCHPYLVCFSYAAFQAANREKGTYVKFLVSKGSDSPLQLILMYSHVLCKAGDDTVLIQCSAIFITTMIDFSAHRHNPSATSNVCMLPGHPEQGNWWRPFTIFLMARHCQAGQPGSIQPALKPVPLQ